MIKAKVNSISDVNLSVSDVICFLQFCLEDVPPKRLRGRKHLFGHIAESLESYLRRVRHLDVHSVITRRTQPQLAGQLVSSVTFGRINLRG